MSKPGNPVNIVWVAGSLKSDPQFKDKQATALIDIGLPTAVTVSIYTARGSNSKLVEQLRTFRKGDYIKVKAMLKPFALKQDDGGYKYGLSIDITEITSLKTGPQAGQPLAHYSADSPPGNWTA